MVAAIALATSTGMGIACTGVLYWLVKRRTERAQKLEQMKKKLQKSVNANKGSAPHVTVIEFQGLSESSSASSGAKQNTKTTDSSQAAFTFMAEDWNQSPEHEQSNACRLEPAPEQESSGISASAPALSPNHSYSQPPHRLDSASQQQSSGVSLSTPAVSLNANRTYSQMLQGAPDNRKPKDTPSQPNSPLVHSHGDDVNANKKIYSAQQALMSQATGDAGLPTEEILPEPIPQPLQPDEEDPPTERSAYHGQPLFISDVMGDTRLTIEDIYIEAMTLAAEIRIQRRQLDDKGQAELSRIMEFCHDALHQKLVISSLAKRAHMATDTL